MQTQRISAVSKLIFELSKLPGIGEKTATRLSYFILKQDENYARSLAESILNAKQRTGLCPQCFTFSDCIPCSTCVDTTRDSAIICVVERPAEVFAIEQTHAFRGLYHVLHGALSPLDGIGPDELKIQELLTRLNDPKNAVREIILATNPSVEGEATSLYLTSLVKSKGIRLTKLANGLPVGGLLEYSDRQTVSKALENRTEMI